MLRYALAFGSMLSFWPGRTAAQGQVALKSQSRVLDSLVHAHAHGLRVERDSFTGPGADLLASASKGAEFVLLGEEHGSVEVPRFARALLKMLRPMGFRHVALEVGPQDATILTKAARGGMSGRNLAELRRTRATQTAFYSKYASDADLLDLVRAEGVDLWGMDQEFIFSSPSQLERLAVLAPTEPARRLVRSFYDRDVAAARADTSINGDGAKRFLRTATDQDFASLLAAYQHAPREAVDAIKELERSAIIYRANAAGLSSSNVLRSRLMKEHLDSYYSAAIKRENRLPKVLFKLGAMHAGRGLSWLNVYDLGNTASELAELHGSTSFHIAFWSGEKLLMSALDGLPEGNWAIVDFVALRERISQMAKGSTDAELVSLAEIMKRYDAMVIAPALTKSTLLR